MPEYRLERDPAQACDGGQAQRAVENVLISGYPLPAASIKADTQANVEACEAAVEQSLLMATSLNPLVGYEKATLLSKEPFRTGATIRQLAWKNEFYQKQRCRKRSIL